MSEQDNLNRLHDEARREGGRLVVWAGGDAKSQGAMYTEAFRARFPDIDIRVTVDLSKYHNARIDHQLLGGALEPDVAHLQTLYDFDHWKEQGVLERYRPEGLEHVPQAFVDPDGFFIPLFVFAFSNVVDTGRVPEAKAPREAADYLKAEFKDRIVLTYPHDDDAVLYQFHQLVQAHGWAWLERLLTQNPLWVRGTATPLSVIGKGDRDVTFTSYWTLAPQPGSGMRFLLPHVDFFQSWYQTGAIFKAARNKAAARLYLSFWLSRAQQQNVAQWPAREDIRLPDGFKHVRWYSNTSPWGFRQFMSDRAKVERLRGLFEQFIGPVEGVNPNTLDL